MANEVTVRAPALALTEKEARNYAAAFAASNMFKGAGANMTPDEALVVIMAGQEFGWGPAAALMNLHVIEGRPELSADAQARFIKAGGKYEYRVTEHTNEACSITFLDAKTGEVIGIERFTMEDADMQDLRKPTRSGRKSAWEKVPRNMLFARCISNGCAFHCPDAVPMRTYAIGEVDDFGRKREQAEDRELRPTPSAEQVKAAQEVEDAVAEEIIEDAEIVPGLRIVLDDDTGDVGPLVTSAPDRFSPEAVEERLRRDLPTLTDEERAGIKQYVLDVAKTAFTYEHLVDLIVKAGYTDVHSWWRSVKAPAPAEPESEKSPYLPSGITGRATGSQTTAKSISDAQMRKFNAECGKIPDFSKEERAILLLRHAGVESSKHLDNAGLDKLLKILHEIQAGGDSIRRLYLGGTDDGK